MVDKNYFHLFHRPFSLVKLALHAFLFFGGACARLFIVHHQNICRSSSLRVFASAYILSPLSPLYSLMWCLSLWCVLMFPFSFVPLCFRDRPVLLFIQHSYRTIITITHRHYVTNFFIKVKKYINNFPILPTKRRIILHQAPLLSSYWLSHKDVPYLVFVQNLVHTPHLIHL